MTIKVKLKSPRSTVDGDSQAVGETITVSDDEAIRLCESDNAEPVEKGKYNSAVTAKAEREAAAAAAARAAENKATVESLRAQAAELMAEADLLEGIEPEGGEGGEGGGDND